jgi:hypothetical protein
VRFSIADLLARPGEIIDAVTAQGHDLAMSSFADTPLTPDEREYVATENRKRAIEAREFVRTTILTGLRKVGIDVPDDFGVLTADDQALLDAAPGGHA